MTAGTQELSVSDSDKALVRRFVRQNDGESFSILMERYTDMVYSTCRRVLRDETLAADAVQETFFELAKNAEKITGSLGSWLHKVATRRSVDLIRQNVSRRNREQNYVLDAISQDSSWSKVEPAVDEALEQLPDNLKEVLLLHFMQGLSTIQIAAGHGVSQPTISRRLAQGLDLLRQNLRERGIVAGLMPVQAVLLHGNHIAPEALRVSLGKIALVKAAGAVPMKIAIAASLLALATGTFLFSVREKKPAVALPKPQAVQAPVRPVENAQVQPEPPPVQPVVVAAGVQAPSPAATPTPPPSTPTRATALPQVKTISIPPAKTEPTPKTVRAGNSTPWSIPAPVTTPSTPVMNDGVRRRAPTVPIELPGLYGSRNTPTNEFSWIPSLYKPTPQPLFDRPAGTNNESRIPQSPNVNVPQPLQPFSPAYNSGPVPPWSIPGGMSRSQTPNKTGQN